MHSNSMMSKWMITLINHILYKDVTRAKGVGDPLLIGDGTPTVGTPIQLYHFDLRLIDGRSAIQRW